MNEKDIWNFIYMKIDLKYLYSLILHLLKQYNPKI